MSRVARLIFALMTGGMMAIATWAAASEPVLISIAPTHPYGSARAHALPENLRRVGQFYFSGQPHRNTDPFLDEWATLKTFFGIRTNINLRMPYESHYGNESSLEKGYLDWLNRLWGARIFDDPRSRLPHGGAVPLTVTTAFSTHDFAPLDEFAEDAKWTFRRAEELLRFYTIPGMCPVLTHCHAGMGRTGQAQALVSYALFGEDMEESISSMRASGGAPNDSQIRFLQAFARKHPRGYLADQVPAECLNER